MGRNGRQYCDMEKPTNSEVPVDVINRIRAFRDSEEEQLIKRSFQNIIESDKLFINLVIEACNGQRGCAFSEAYVELAPYIQTDDIRPISEKFGLIYMKLLFELDILEKFIKNGVDAALINRDQAVIFLSLLEFLRDRRMHRKAIQEIINENPGETSVMIALAQHLFSQLIPGKKYMLNGSAKQLPEKCPDCNNEIETGNTSIGSSFTWHGKADILNGTVAVAVVGGDVLESDNADIDGNNYENNLEPTAKKRKAELEAKTEISEDNESEARSKDILMRLHTIEQIVAEAVSNGFAQVNVNSSLRDLLIPMIGCTGEHASVFLYDPLNDILLQACDLFHLWHTTCTDKLLSAFSVVCLWLFLNFPTFTVKHLKDKVDLDKSNFHKYMKNNLKFYQAIKTGMSVCESRTSRPVTDNLRMYCRIRQAKE